MASPNVTAERLILASASPRRRQLLEEAGFSFDVQPSPVEEPGLCAAKVEPSGLAEALSFFKARTVDPGKDDCIILGADTVVACKGCVYGKPNDVTDARRILGALMHHPHEVVTGIALLRPAHNERVITHDVTRVFMRPMPDNVFEAYLESGHWEGKAGAYGIQDHGDEFIDRIEGSFTNVMGLPMECVVRLLENWGHRPRGASAP